MNALFIVNLHSISLRGTPCIEVNILLFENKLFHYKNEKNIKRYLSFHHQKKKKSLL